jgi:cytochrome b
VTEAAGAARRVLVWDPAVRVGHWLLVSSVAVAWLTRAGSHEWHEIAGYVALAIVALRVLWGWVGPARARFSDFVVRPAAGLAYARDMMKRREARHLGHNPLGGWMILALLLVVALLGFTGWLYTTDRYWGVEWVETLHSRLADLLWILVGLHVAGVLYASFHHRENLPAAMLHGRKRKQD